MRWALFSLSIAATCLVACGTPPVTVDGGTDVPRDSGPADLVLGGSERPARLVLPYDHDGVTERPLVVLLHGYSASATLQDAYFGLSRRARVRGVYVLLPEGTEDAEGNQFWNATDACCDFGSTGVDDAGYLTGLLDEAEAMVPIDTSRIYFMGHSNGGFMSYRMACEVGERIAAIATLAGSDFEADDTCAPTSAPSVLHMHGTADDTVPFTGGSITAASFPGAVEVTERWAARAGCDVTSASMGTALDFVSTLEGAETAVTDYTVGCTEGRSASLWAIEGGVHIPGLRQPELTDAVLDWLLAHSR